MEVIQMLKLTGIWESEELPSILPKYEYRELEPGWTRIANVAPGAGSDPLFCEIVDWPVGYQHVPGRPANFNALSYTWGADRDATPLIAQDNVTREVGVINVTKSLVTALNAIRRPKEWMALWVDQISINQSDQTEKEQQLASMRVIYETAGRVLAWLGPAADNSDELMDSIASKKWDGKMDILTENLHRGRPIAEAHKIFSDALPCSLDTVRAFLSRPYWTRVWILQEATAHPSVETIIQCGTKQISLNMFIVIANMQLPLRPYFEQLTDELNELLISLLPLQAYMKFEQERHSRQDQWYCPLLQLMTHIRSLDVTDPRDRVNVMLNYAAENKTAAEMALKPNYDMQTHELYRYVAVWHIARTRSLDVLQDASRSIDNDTDPKEQRGPVMTSIRSYEDSSQDNVPLSETSSEPREVTFHPSWAPDWSNKILLPPIQKYQQPDIEGSPLLFRASGRYVDDLQAQFRISQDVRCLYLSGLKVGTITATTETCSEEENTTIDRIQETWLNFDTNIKEYELTGEPLQDAIKRTIVRDCRSISGSCQTPFTVRRLLPDEVPVFDVHARQDPVLPSQPTPWPLDIARSSYGHQLISTSRTSRFYHESALYGLAPGSVEVGDELWMLRGGKVLYALRPRRHQFEIAPNHLQFSYIRNVLDMNTGDIDTHWITNQTVYTLTGECYVHGLMDGEFVDLPESGIEREAWPLPLQETDPTWEMIHLA